MWYLRVLGWPHTFGGLVPAAASGVTVPGAATSGATVPGAATSGATVPGVTSAVRRQQCDVIGCGDVGCDGTGCDVSGAT